jgi:hypothetical protein
MRYDYSPNALGPGVALSAGNCFFTFPAIFDIPLLGEMRRVEINEDH